MYVLHLPRPRALYAGLMSVDQSRDIYEDAQSLEDVSESSEEGSNVPENIHLQIDLNNNSSISKFVTSFH